MQMEAKLPKQAALKWALNIIERMRRLVEAVNLVIYNIQTFMILSQQTA